jgi:hypothetical protein
MTDDLVQQLFAEADNFKVDREVGVRGMLYRAADRIEAQAAEIERLEALFTNSTYEAKAMMEEIDRRGAEIQALREMQGKDSHD